VLEYQAGKFSVVIMGKREDFSLWFLNSHGTKERLLYFSIDNAHLLYNAHPDFFDIPFDV
jgi:hypothetical protein